MDGLVKWRTADAFASQVAALTAHPRFADAARALAANMLAAGESDKALDGVFKDAGRYVAALWALYLHVTEGLTLPRLKEVCASSGYLSPGRARALLLYLRHLGYVEPITVGTRAAPSRYAPTPVFVAAWSAHLRAALEATRVVEPAVAVVLDRLDERAVFDGLARIQGALLLQSAQRLDQGDALIRVFQHRYAGLQVLFLLLIDGGTDAFPSAGPIAFSITKVARRFGVSRIHLRRLLDEAQREGLLHCAEDGAVTLSESARASIAFFYGAQIVQLLAIAAAVAEERKL